MTRFCLTLVFSASSVAGLGLILYAILAGRRNRGSIDGECVALGFSESAGESAGVLDLDIGHEGLKHRGKETFDPKKHKPEPI